MSDRTDPSPIDPELVRSRLLQRLSTSSDTQSSFCRRNQLSTATLSRFLNDPSRARAGFVRSVQDALDVGLAARDPDPEVCRVFISSTFLDLEERRSLVIRAIEAFSTKPRMECIAMERWSASPLTADELSVAQVQQADVFVGIYAYRYGWQPEASQLSAIELEHDEALRLDLPIYAFSIDEKHQPCTKALADPGEDWTQKQGKLEAFKRKLRSGGTVKPFKGDGDLVLAVTQAMREWRESQGFDVISANAPKVDPHESPAARELSNYRDVAEREHRQLPMTGFPLSLRMPIGLDELFVPLQASERYFSDGEDEPARPRKGAVELPDGEDELLEGAGAPGGARRLPFARSQAPGDGDGLGETVFTCAQEKSLNAIVVEGVVGSGKTSQLRRLLRGCLVANPEQLLGLKSSGKRLLPVFLPLRELTAKPEKGWSKSGKGKAFLKEWLVRAIDEVLGKVDGLDQPGRALVGHGALLLLLDGLDEVRAELRAGLPRWIAALTGALPEAFVVVSTRPAGFGQQAREALCPAAACFGLEPLSEDAREAFVEKWYAIVERATEPQGWRTRAREGASDLVERLSKSSVQATRVYEMTANPLLLTVICLVHKDHSQELPERREELYRVAALTLVETWRRRELSFKLNAQAAVEILGPVALALHQEKGRVSADASFLADHLEGPLAEHGWSQGAPAFLRFLRDESGIFAGESGERYRFIHLGFQEYFAARELHGQLAQALADRDEEAVGADKRVPELTEAIAKRLGEEWWREASLLLLALPEKPHLFRRLLGKFLGDAPHRAADHEIFLRDAIREGAGRDTAPFIRALRRCLDLDDSHESQAIPALVRLLVGFGAKGLEALTEESLALLVAENAPFEAADLVHGKIENSQHYSKFATILNKAQKRRAERREQGQGAPATLRSVSNRSTVALLDPHRAPMPERLIGLGLEFVEVPAGEFKMGAIGRHRDEQPIHKVSLDKPFYLARTPVTNGQYRAYVKERNARSPKSWGNSRLNDDDQPVVDVSWEEARAFCEWLGGRLPSEAEWEYACRAGTTTEYWFGDGQTKLGESAWFRKNSGGSSRPVGQKPANPFGLYDMHGNVWEWCQDRWHGDYEGAPTDGSAWEKGGSSARVIRGGSWWYDADSCRSAYRLHGHPSTCHGDLGFRPALTPRQLHLFTHGLASASQGSCP